MIDIRKLKELVRLMVENDLTELDLRDSEEQVTMRRPNPMSGTAVMTAPTVMVSPATATLPAPGFAMAPASGNGASAPASEQPSSLGEDGDLLQIRSPMVGTFYATPNPDSPPFAPVGTAVSAEKVVCIIEAMKIFNEIKAECSGVIHKVLAKSGDPVEFGQPLFLVKPG
ncbi:MAG: acetyl-CoA carboxylase biotin carboxyl carrier protein [Phycisphaerales bacterium]|nr:acetyl-CoA carboxylase biotin carboxyl carrier protein [Phycisphaerales bacterium]MCI0629233.1 acetyl-CoA carboxylase biotin carboxyl carrier protein [Phycisphaerales bacterium]MCI0675886.1 acetyl-CoA carboxylase biotin carboxyl carrier protein [Phycisphaerales bacterium]